MYTTRSKNSGWTAIGLGADVPAGTTRAILLDGTELVAWRSAAGHVQLWRDRCPHRGMRLSLGFVRGERLACLYHGWEYGAGGACQRIPAHPDLAVPPSIRVQGRRVAEAGGLIWTCDDAALPTPDDTDMAPLASLFIASPLARVLARLGAEEGTTTATLEGNGMLIQLGWHQPRLGETMLHAVTASGVDRLAALDVLKTLRHDVETEQAA